MSLTPARSLQHEVTVHQSHVGEGHAEGRALHTFFTQIRDANENKILPEKGISGIFLYGPGAEAVDTLCYAAYHVDNVPDKEKAIRIWLLEVDVPTTSRSLPSVAAMKVFVHERLDKQDWRTADKAAKIIQYARTNSYGLKGTLPKRVKLSGVYALRFVAGIDRLKRQDFGQPTLLLPAMPAVDSLTGALDDAMTALRKVRLDKTCVRCTHCPVIFSPLTSFLSISFPLQSHTLPSCTRQEFVDDYCGEDFKAAVNEAKEAKAALVAASRPSVRRAAFSTPQFNRNSHVDRKSPASAV